MGHQTKPLNLNIRITDFAEADREQLRQIYQQVRQAAFTWLPRASFELSSFDRDTEGERIWVAKSEHETVGLISVWQPDHFVHHLYVSDAFQRLGIGSLLLNQVIVLSSSDLTLKCLKQNESGINFYLKLGWEPESEGVSKEGAYILFRYRIPTK